tara:strand:+ start:172 stop:738 length:567 start_codon:yes stop_codon:yes gene_type:complete
MPHKKGHKVTGKLGLRKRLDQMLHGDRKNKQMSKQTTVPDSQKRGMKSTATMSDEQKRASRANVTNRPDMSDAQKRTQTRPKNTSDMSDAQKRPAKAKTTMADVQKKRQVSPKNTTAMSDAQKRTQTKSEPKTFKEAFRRARQEGKAKFTYKGKSYAAVTQDEVNKAFKAGKIKKKTLRAFLNMKKKK